MTNSTKGTIKMNLLKKLTVHGDIFSEYAYLSFEFLFESQKCGADGQYIFRLPTGACISNMMIGIRRGEDCRTEIITPKIVAAAHLCGIKNLTDIACLTRLTDDAYSIRIKSPGTECRLILNVYAPLEFFAEKQRINIPLSLPKSGEPFKTDVDITARGAAISEVFSNSHNILCDETSSGISIRLNDEPAGNDLNIEINAFRRVNSAIAATDGLNTEMLCHFYPTEKFLTAVGFGDKIKDAEIRSSCGKGTIIKYPERAGDSLDAIFELHGLGARTEFEIQCGGMCESFIIENGHIYNSFAPIRLLQAEKLCAELYGRLDGCAPDEVQSIKRRIEKIGVKYSALNTETAFVADLGNNEYGLIRTNAVNSENKPRLYDSCLGALDNIAEAKPLDEYVHILITLMHSDGAICTDDEYNRDGRRLQTLLAVLALIAADSIDPTGGFVRAAKAYVGNEKIRGLSFTPDSGTAIVMLKSFIVSNRGTTIGTPEFYSAIKQLCNANA